MRTYVPASQLTQKIPGKKKRGKARKGKEKDKKRGGVRFVFRRVEEKTKNAHDEVNLRPKQTLEYMILHV